ncbi:NADH:ubiquinone oxidoreductase intermediate-associated protein 30 [Pelagophyceae sp. CCMP2097]|nr:NADH:ubiquinone oxidoreductase intermediate-associated protein 30 [Pelagophyceae sp. CCMP2097]
MDALRLVNGLPDAIPRTLPLFSLNNRSEWKYEVITDKSVGGRSTASFHVAKLPGGGVGGVFEGVIYSDTVTDFSLPEDQHELPKLGFAILTIQRKDGAAKKAASRRGRVVDAYDYDALSLRCITDGRLYSLSLRGATPYAPDLAYQGNALDLAYQGYIMAPHSKTFQNMLLPFENFVATRGGRLMNSPRRLDLARIDLVSFSVADHVRGPFRFVFEEMHATEPYA